MAEDGRESGDGEKERGRQVDGEEDERKRNGKKCGYLKTWKEGARRTQVRIGKGGAVWNGKRRGSVEWEKGDAVDTEIIDWNFSARKNLLFSLGEVG